MPIHTHKYKYLLSPKKKIQIPTIKVAMNMIYIYFFNNDDDDNGLLIKQ